MAPIRIGIVGGRGIGKHHAKWFAQAGCEITAVYGTTPESAEAAASAFRDAFGFFGRAFNDWEAFRKEGEFEACSVCSPAECHWPNVRDLAADGKHLLCEKPLVWHWDAPPNDLIEEGRRLVDEAARCGVILAMNAQYPAALEGWTELYRQARGVDPEFRSLYFVMATRGKPRSDHGAAEAWVDLAPHPLAFLDRIAPGRADWPTLRHESTDLEAIVEFEWLSGADRIPVHIECRRTPDGTMRRLIGNQEFVAEYEGANRDGQFGARLHSGSHEWFGKDFMRVSVERFVEAVRLGDGSRVLVDGNAALRQQEALVGVCSRCWTEPGEKTCE